MPKGSKKVKRKKESETTWNSGLLKNVTGPREEECLEFPSPQLTSSHLTSSHLTSSQFPSTDDDSDCEDMGASVIDFCGYGENIASSTCREICFGNPEATTEYQLMNPFCAPLINNYCNRNPTTSFCSPGLGSGGTRAGQTNRQNSNYQGASFVNPMTVVNNPFYSQPSNIPSQVQQNQVNPSQASINRFVSPVISTLPSGQFPTTTQNIIPTMTPLSVSPGTVVPTSGNVIIPNVNQTVPVTVIPTVAPTVTPTVTQTVAPSITPTVTVPGTIFTGINNQVD